MKNYYKSVNKIEKIKINNLSQIELFFASILQIGLPQKKQNPTIKQRKN